MLAAINLSSAQSEHYTEESDSPEAETAEILIFRTSPGKVEKAEGWFRFQVSTFSPLMVVKVNGFAQMIQKNPEAQVAVDWGEYEIPYFLKRGKNLFTVFVQTESGEREQNFFVSLQPPQKKKKTPPPLSGVVMLGQTHSDNMLRAKEGKSKTATGKNDFLLSAAYAFVMSKESDISLKGILKFDRQQSRDLSAEEVLFRSFSSEYRNQNLLGLDFSTGLGQSVISVKASLTDANQRQAGEFRKDTQSLFFFLAGKKKWGKFAHLSLKLQGDSQDKIKSSAEDGTLSLTSLGGKLQWGGISLGIRADSRTTQFKDTSKDYQSLLANTGLTYPWEPWVFGLTFQNTDQQYKEIDPATLLKLHNKKDKFSLNCKYMFSRSTLADVSLTQIKQTSNDATRTFRENQTVLQWIWMF